MNQILLTADLEGVQGPKEIQRLSKKPFHKASYTPLVMGIFAFLCMLISLTGLAFYIMAGLGGVGYWPQLIIWITFAFLDFMLSIIGLILGIRSLRIQSSTRASVGVMLSVISLGIPIAIYVIGLAILQILPSLEFSKQF